MNGNPRILRKVLIKIVPLELKRDQKLIAPLTRLEFAIAAFQQQMSHTMLLENVFIINSS